VGSDRPLDDGPDATVPPSPTSHPLWHHDPADVDVHLAHVAVTTGDLDRMRWFYAEVVGLHLRSLASPAGAPYDRVASFGSDDGDRLVVYEVPGYLASERARRQSPLFEHLALCLPDPMALTALEARLRAAGHLDREPAGRRGSRLVAFTDPDGTQVFAASRPPHISQPTTDTPRSTPCAPPPPPVPPSAVAGWPCSSHRPWRW
jgi:catechol 2,3-dioxygenase-like lactoylglutathione lyase family enzyme